MKILTLIVLGSTFSLNWYQVQCLSQADHTRRIGIVGGGASGMFSAAAAASEARKHNLKIEVHVLESSPKLMSKVEVSGGGRCNVLHDTAKPVSEILSGYPRGKKELNGIFSKYFSPKDAEKWFRDRGVELKTEGDGRMFPVTDSSKTIIDCIAESARKNNVQIRTNHKVISIRRRDDGDNDMGGFSVSLLNKDLGEVQEYYNCIIIATGSSPKGYEIASSLGHNLIPTVPSLFTFNTKNQNKEGQIFYNLAGLSVKSAIVSLKIKVEGKKKKKVIQQQGPLLFTHHGLSGPAVLRLSAFAAREFKELDYRTDITIHWAPEFGSAQDIEDRLWLMTSLSPKKSVSSVCPLMDTNGASVIPRRLWSAIVMESDINKDATWAETSRKKIGILSRNIAEFVVDVTGRGVFKEEFVTAGGVDLKEITMKTMESKICPGVFFCGEIIDVDGITGGFNFMNCWSSGYTAGTSAVHRLTTKQIQEL